MNANVKNYATAGATGAILALMFVLIPEAAGVEPLDTPTSSVKAPSAIQEDDPRWNCLTMGNGVCGPSYVKVTQGIADALAEGGTLDATTRDWEACLIAEGDTSYVVCPDGTVETS